MARRAKHYVQILDVRNRDTFKTGQGAAGRTYKETKALFEMAIKYEVPQKRATFLVDLHNESGDLVGTILIDGRGYKALTGAAKVPTHAECRELDAQHWADARQVKTWA